jgi:hypothetical protein
MDQKKEDFTKGLDENDWVNLFIEKSSVFAGKTELVKIKIRRN